ncbi:MAG: pyridoxamine 5'-phosphate oxidase [Candidatus Omnitrophica bacterium]|nr:pyridoxamine 5'-phosphate oxidase [Candidatus Omnitrophota bacterium]
MDQIIPRQAYNFGKLDEKKLLPDPIHQFQKWFKEVLRSNTPHPNAMTLATASRKGRPSARMVLLKGFDENGFIFYTNYKSRKSKEIHENPFGSLVFYWPGFERQVIIAGRVKKISHQESERYFSCRPRESCLAAWSSQQGDKIQSREALEKKFNAMVEKYQGKQIPLPSNWGGFCLKPETIEFWQGRANRLNDRILYTKSKGRWTKQRLQP